LLVEINSFHKKIIFIFIFFFFFSFATTKPSKKKETKINPPFPVGQIHTRVKRERGGTRRIREDPRSLSRW